MQNFLKDYFTFNKGDRNGIIVLLLLLFALLFFYAIMNSLIPEKKIDFSKYYSLVAELEKAQMAEDASKKQTYYSNSASFSKTEYAHTSNNSTKAPNLFQFNPNQLSEEKWRELGLPEKQIKTIKHFEEKGGRFYKKEDLKKIYGLSPQIYAQLESYIQLPDKQNKDYEKKYTTYSKQEYPNKKNGYPTKPKAQGPVEINLADTSDLQSLKGIGAAFAKRIFNYREKLGGFISFNQLHEVWGLDSETIRMLIPQLTLNTAAIRKIPINHCSVSELKKHPYLTYNIANNIVLYRDRHGDYSKLEDIRLAVLVNEELFRKIAPYLTLN